MAEAKIEIKVGAVSFSGEGDGKWLSDQLDKVLEKIPELSKVAPEAPERSGADGGSGTTGKKATGNLAAFLKERNATSNQVRKFLATAMWLHDHNKLEFLNTTNVVEALSTAKQSDLTNPSQCLAANVTKGYCQKQGKKQFYITPEGRAELG